MAKGKKGDGMPAGTVVEQVESGVAHLKNRGTLFAKVAKSVGGSVMSKRPGVREWIDTGNLALNQACSGKYFGGGCPNGRVIECFGPSSSGKTLVGNNMLRGVQLLDGWPVFIDAENSVDAEFAARTSHLDPDQVIVLEEGVDTIEAAFDKIHDVVLQIRRDVDPHKPIFMVYDSIAASPSEKEFEGSALHALEEEEKRKANKDMPGDRAKACSKEFRRLGPVLKRMNASVFFINQIRNKIGVMFGSPETTAGGGKSLEYYASLRLRTRAEKKFTDKLGNVIGLQVTVQNVKNKCFRPFVVAEKLQLYFDKGINPVSGLLSSLIRAGRVVCVKKASGQYAVLNEWSGGEEVTFRSSEERNDVPVEVLLKCPSLVDAPSQDALAKYLATFESGLHAHEDVAGEQVVRESGEDGEVVPSEFTDETVEG